MDILAEIQEFMKNQEFLTGYTHTLEFFSDFSGSIRKSNRDNEPEDILVFDNLQELENKLNKHKDGIYQELSHD